MSEVVQRLRDHYAGKQRRDISNPCITAREAIEVADHIVALEAQVLGYGRNASYYRCCALSGEVPDDSSRPYMPMGEKDCDSGEERMSGDS